MMALKNVTGFIYCDTPDSLRGSVLVSGIRLMRYHDKGDMKSESADSLAVDAAGNENHKLDGARPQRLTPSRLK